MNKAGYNAEEIWSSAATRLRAKSESLYNQWFACMLPLDVQQNCLTLGVPDDFFRDMVESNYHYLLQEALAGIGGVDFTYTLEPGHEKPAPAPVQPARHARIRPAAAAALKGAPVPAVAVPAVHNSLHSYHFTNFVVGMSNRHAFAAAKAVSEAPGVCYNPLFIYGSSGVGKTHLLQAVAAELRQQHPELIVRSVTCDEMLNDYYELLMQKRGSFAEFRNSFKDVDVLLIDDIHRLSKKTQMQEEFFNIFNLLYRQNKQIVLTSDRHPCEIADLDVRLSSRFEQGMTCEVGMLEYDERLSALRMWRDASMARVPLADRYLEFLAENISSHVRRLKGCFLRLSAYVDMSRSDDISIEEVEDLLHAQLAEENSTRDLRPEAIQQTVARHFGITVSDIIGTKRNRQSAEPRMVAMYLCRELTKLSSNEIGDAFGRTHANILHAAKTIAKRVEEDSEMRRSVSSLRRQLQKH